MIKYIKVLIGWGMISRNVVANILQIISIILVIIFFVKMFSNYKEYYRNYVPKPSHKYVELLLLILPWLLLLFPFTFDWSTYCALVIVRLPFTIIWFLVMLLGAYVDYKLKKKYNKYYYNSKKSTTKAKVRDL